MMKLIFGGIAFAAGLSISYGLKQAGLPYLEPQPSSPLFMLLALLVIMIVYQFRMNAEFGQPKGAMFWFAPPTQSILGEFAGFFAGWLIVLNLGK